MVDELDDEQRARLSIITELIKLAVDCEVDAFDLTRMARWVEIGCDPDMHAADPTETVQRITSAPPPGQALVQVDVGNGSYTLTDVCTGRSSEPLPYNCTAEQHAAAARKMWEPAVR